MIKINNIEVDMKEENRNRFPDGTFAFKIDKNFYRLDYAIIHWFFESNEELFALYSISQHLKEKGIRLTLIMPYIPNARMDRTKNVEDVFFLKYFSDIINLIGFHEVIVLDAHSEASLELINNCTNGFFKLNEIEEEITTHIDNIKPILFCFPDKGAVERNADRGLEDFIYAVKDRDWETGEIKGLRINIHGYDLSLYNIVIVDDICSAGGTIHQISQLLKQDGAEDVYAFVTHCEDTIYKGEILKNNYIKKVFTTKSLIKDLSSDKIVIIDVDIL